MDNHRESGTIMDWPIKIGVMLGKRITTLFGGIYWNPQIIETATATHKIIERLKWRKFEYGSTSTSFDHLILKSGERKTLRDYGSYPQPSIEQVISDILYAGGAQIKPTNDRWHIQEGHIMTATYSNEQFIVTLELLENGITAKLKPTGYIQRMGLEVTITGSFYAPMPTQEEAEKFYQELSDLVKSK